MEMTREELVQKIAADVERNGQYAVVNGGYGDMEDTRGLVEEIIKPEEGGTYVKMYGCSYLMKGYPEQQTVFAFGLPKSMLSAIPREMVAKSAVMKMALAFLFLFRRKKLIHMFRVYFSMIYANSIEKLQIPDIRYNKTSRELRRAVNVVIERRHGKPKEGELPILHRDTDLSTGREVAELIALVTEFFCLLIELDTAYRYRIQDILMLLDKEQVKKSALKEITRLTRIMVERENSPQMRDKFNSILVLLRLFFLLSPQMKEWARDILLEINISNVKLDAADWYFCLKRTNHDFGGVPIAYRLEEKVRIDKEKGHAPAIVSMDDTGVHITIT